MNDTSIAMMREALHRLDLPIAEARGLPPSAYTSPEFFRQEEERLFRGGWMSVAFSHDIPAPGDAMPVTMAGVELLIVRDSKQKVRAFHNVCRHRCATVLDAPTKGLKTIRCPYHGWSYGLDGNLVLAPMWDGPGGGRLGRLDADANALAPVACGEWQDIVFVNIDGMAGSLSDFVAPLDDRWKGFDLLSTRAPFAHAERVIPANWKVVLEGFLEVYHEACLHPTLTYRVDEKGRPNWTDITEGDVMGFAGILPARDPNAAPSVLPRVPGMPATGAATADIFLLFPATAINMLEDHVVRTIWTPVSATETRWRSAWYFAADAGASEAVHNACLNVVEFWQQIRAEDLSAIVRVQKGLSSVGFPEKQIQFSPFWEEIVRHFQRHISRRLIDE